MAIPNTLGSYEDCFALYARAAANEKGSRALLGDFAAANHFRMRMNKARSLDREESRRIYEENAPQYNKSEYDRLSVTLREDTDGKWWVYVAPHGQVIETIEDL